MKSTGIVRPIDMLGRIVIPIEIRRNLDIEEKDLVEIYTDADTIVLKKHAGTCVFCGADEGLSDFKGKLVCDKCKSELR